MSATPPPVARSFSAHTSPPPARNSSPGNHLGVSGAGRGHHHSHSHSGAPASSQSIPAIGRPAQGPQTAVPPTTSNQSQAQPQNNQSQNQSSQNKFRASVDAARAMGMGAGSIGLGRAPGGQRPSSEMLPGGAGLGLDPETDAIDRWFEDLQHYEQTLEEMAAASLDQNFKEELGAIEQWFRVLSEAERTAALYSLLQSSTQVQIRFFITVLQQIARNDPSNAALLSPSNPQQASMEAQMEARLSSLNLGKGPASPAMRQFARQSVGATGSDFGNFLSPNDDPNSILASQRAKLKAQAHRISAPGTLSSFSTSTNSAGLWAPEAIAEGSVRSASPNSHRPKSTGSDYSVPAGNMANNLLRSPNMGTSSFDELSPMPGNGSWASMVNTPVVPMFGNSTNAEDAPLSPRLDLADMNNKFAATWGSATTQPPTQRSVSGPNVVLDDAKKFRRSGRVDGTNNLGSSLGNLPQGGNGVLGNFGTGNRSVSAGQPARSASPNLLSPQQAAALSAQQNWRNINGLLTPNSAGSNNGAANLGNMSPADMANALLLQQQQMQLQMQAQLQLQQNLMGMSGMNGMNGMMGNMLSPNLNNNNLLAMGMMNNMNPGNLSPGLSPGGNNPRRSPRMSNERNANQGNRTPSSAQMAPGSGSNPDEPIDLKLLEDIPAWLRSLRLHKYTTNFDGCKWQDVVRMDEAALEGKGVAAQGARRKLLKVFENVRCSVFGEERPPPSSPLIGGKEDGDDS